jgi:hypothetical protein
MFKFEIPSIHDNFWTDITVSQPHDKKFISVKGNDGLISYYMTLSEELHKWMIDNNIEYNLSLLTHEYYAIRVLIEFASDDDAMLFKLTCGGK